MKKLKVMSPSGSGDIFIRIYRVSCFNQQFLTPVCDFKFWSSRLLYDQGMLIVNKYINSLLFLLRS